MQRALRLTLLAVGLIAPAAVLRAQPTQMVFGFSQTAVNTSTLLLNGTTSFTASSRGWYQSNGSSNGSSVSNNYIAGQCGPVGCFGSGEILRNWFQFDLANFTPVATSAVLRLSNPSNGFASTLGSSLDYSLFDVMDFLGLGGGNSTAVYNDLGTGTQYGSTTVTSAQNGTTIDITLNAAALMSINTARQNGTWALGGAVGPSNVVPEPSTWALMMVGLAGIVVAGNARRKAQ